MNLSMLEEIPPWEWPQDTDQTLLSILNDSHAGETDRCLAAALAGDFVVINDALADKLLKIVQDSSETETMRGNAVISLGTALEHADTMGFEDDQDILVSEEVFRRVQNALHTLFMDKAVPEAVRGKILETSVRAPQKWHTEAVRTAYADKDPQWRLTALFCMRYVNGFDEQIVAALDSPNADIQYQAVCAAGNWEVDAAWSHIAALVTAEQTEKTMLLAAIDASAKIRPQEATVLLDDLMDDDDEEISDAVFEALTLAGMIESLDDEAEEGH